MSLGDVRRAKGLTQREVAQRAGISKSLYQKLESGSRMPSVDTLFDVAVQLSLPVATELAQLFPSLIGK